MDKTLDKLLEVDYEEIEYTDMEEAEVIKEIRLGLMLNEINAKVSKRDLKEWFARLQMSKKNWCINVTGEDLVKIAKECGLKIKS